MALKLFCLRGMGVSQKFRTKNLIFLQGFTTWLWAVWVFGVSQPLFPCSCHWLFPVSGTGHESWLLFHDIASSCELSPPLLRVRACPGLCCDYTVYQRTCHGLFTPAFQTPVDFSVSQWKSELLSMLGFFSSDQHFAVCAGFSGDGRDAVRPGAFPWWCRCDMDTGNTGCDQAGNMDSLLEQLFEESKPPLCRFFRPQQALKLKFAAFSHCHSGWKTPPCSFQCQHVEICSLGLSLLQSWVLPKPLSHLPVISSVSPWGPRLCWAGSMSTQGISISIYLCRCTVPSSETCQPHESRVTTSLPWHYWTALHWLWSHKGESSPAIWGLGLFFSILSFFHLAEEELLQKWLTRTWCWDEPLGSNTRLGTGVIFLTPSRCYFGLMSIPHSICSGR